MSISSNSAAPNGPRSISLRLTHVGLLALLLTGTSAAAAQTSAAKSWEFRVTSGAFVPTGNQRYTLDDAQMSAAQLSWLVRPSLAISGTFAWARSRDVATANNPKLDVFSSDLGVEARGRQLFAKRAVTLSPFVGVGAGARSYNYRKLDVNATNNLAGYGAIGGELGVKRLGLRLELRDYAAGFKPLVGTGTSHVRNDVVMMAGIRIKHRTHAN